MKGHLMINKLFTQMLKLDTKLRVWYNTLTNQHVKAFLGILYTFAIILMFVGFVALLTGLLVGFAFLFGSILLVAGIPEDITSTIVIGTSGYMLLHFIVLERNNND